MLRGEAARRRSAAPRASRCWLVRARHVFSSGALCEEVVGALNFGRQRNRRGYGLMRSASNPLGEGKPISGSIPPMVEAAPCVLEVAPIYRRHRYGRIQAVVRQVFSRQVGEGEIRLAVLGANGAGKSVAVQGDSWASCRSARRAGSRSTAPNIAAWAAEAGRFLRKGAGAGAGGGAASSPRFHGAYENLLDGWAFPRPAANKPAPVSSARGSAAIYQAASPIWAGAGGHPRHRGGFVLSGGEQQMLAIRARGLLGRAPS